MAGRQIVVNLVSDSQDFERSMKRSEEALGGVAKELDKTTDEAQGFKETLDEAGGKVGDARAQIKGTTSLLGGLDAVFGTNTEALKDNLSAYAGLAKGIKGGLIPAMKQGATAAKAMSTALLTTPWGRIALGVAALGAITVATTQDQVDWTDQMHKAEDAASSFVNFTQKTSLKVWGALDGAIGGNGSKLLKHIGILNAHGDAALTDAQKQMRLQAVMAAGLDSGSDPDGAFASSAALASVDWQRSVDQDWMAFESKTGIYADKTEKVGASAGKALKNGMSAELSAKWTPVEKVLKSALDKFKTDIDSRKDLRDSLRNLFRLDVKNDPMGFVAGLRAQVVAAEAFVKKIAELRKMGFRKSIVDQLADRGPGALGDAIELSHVSVKDVNGLADRAKSAGNAFGDSEVLARMGKQQKVQVELKVSGGDKDLVNIIKKWVRTEGGGNVQVAFGK